MANVLNVRPTRMELRRLRDELEIAEEGYEMLKNKQDELMRQFIGLVQENNDLRKDVEKRLTKSLQSFVLAKSLLNEHFVEELVAIPSQSVSLDIRTKNIMSVFVPDMTFNIDESGASDFQYGYLNSNPEMDQALDNINNVLNDLLKLSEIEKTTQMLADEIESTRRRVNALEYQVIPDTQETIKYIDMKIEESQRAAVTRMIKIKDLE